MAKIQKMGENGTKKRLPAKPLCVERKKNVILLFIFVTWIFWQLSGCTGQLGPNSSQEPGATVGVSQSCSIEPRPSSLLNRTDFVLSRSQCHRNPFPRQALHLNPFYLGYLFVSDLSNAAGRTFLFFQGCSRCPPGPCPLSVPPFLPLASLCLWRLCTTTSHHKVSCLRFQKPFFSEHYHRRTLDLPRSHFAADFSCKHVLI